MSEAAQTIDAAQAELGRRGWCAGDVAIKTAAGVLWMVYAHRDGHRIASKGTKQATAWREAVRLACR